MSDTQTKIPWMPTAAQRAIIEELAGLVDQEKSQAEFCRKHLSYGENKLGRILNVLKPDNRGSYFDQVADPDVIITEIGEDLARISTEEFKENSPVEKIHPIKSMLAVVAAVRKAKNRKDRNRIVKYISPTGGGKTVICHKLKTEFGARLMEARQGWKHGRFNFLSDVCKALRVRLDEENRASYIERTLIDSVRNKSIVMVIDEGEYFGGESLNDIKLLINQTKLIFVICSMPKAHNKWNTYFPEEAAQIACRTLHIVRQEAIETTDADLFFPPDQFQDRAKALKYICDEASIFGHFSFLGRLADHLKSDDKATEATVKKACAIVRRQMLTDAA